MVQNGPRTMIDTKIACVAILIQVCLIERWVLQEGDVQIFNVRKSELPVVESDSEFRVMSHCHPTRWVTRSLKISTWTWTCQWIYPNIATLYGPQAVPRFLILSSYRHISYLFTKAPEVLQPTPYDWAVASHLELECGLSHALKSQ